MPGQHQEQQREQRKQQTGSRIRHIKRLMIHDLASETGFLLCHGHVVMEQPEVVEPDEAQQRDLDDPGAHTMLRETQAFEHIFLPTLLAKMLHQLGPLCNCATFITAARSNTYN